jgi:teichuronic acid biosynthesis glycosyltransferase TuaC
MSDEAIRLLTFTTLFPNAEQPNHGIFVENRLQHLLAGGDVASCILAPVPFFPLRSPRFGKWSRYARVPTRETRANLVVHHPRYPVIPGIGMSLAPFLLYRASVSTLNHLVRNGLSFDIIDAHYVYPDGVAAMWLGQRFRKPVVITARGSDVTQLPDYTIPRRLIQATLRRADGLIAVSSALGERLRELGAPAERVRVLRNGVDTVAFRPTDRAAARQILGLSRPTLLSVGLLIERKGHDRLIEAMLHLPDFDLRIVGEGPEREKLAGLIERLGLAGRVRLLGAYPHRSLPAMYTAADALVLASSREGWANVLLEAMACGTPVVASDIPGNGEVVRSREAGLLMDRSTPAGIAEAVRRLFADPPTRAATRAYAERFGWDETSAGQRDLFRALIGRAARGRDEMADVAVPDRLVPRCLAAKCVTPLRD